MHSHRLVLAVVLGATLLLASCGSSDNSNGAGETPSVTGAAGETEVVRTPQQGGDLFSMSVDGVPGCDTGEGDAECKLDAGQSFTVSIRLNSLPSGVSLYEGWDGILQYTGVTLAEDPNENVWPECEFAAAYFDTPGVAAVGCALGVENVASTYTGTMATLQFNCPAEPSTGSISMLHGEGNTVLWENVASEWSDSAGTEETLAIQCGTP
jgi:hypothetical protein